jgi:hypothetical protein
MRSTIINQHIERSFDLVIDGSSLYDIVVDHNLNDIDMNSIYNKSLSTRCLMIDANVSGQTFSYIRNVENYDDVVTLEPTSDVPQSDYFQYQYANSRYTMFADRMESGWSAEFITDFDQTLTHTGSSHNILFYMGKTMNLSGHTSGFTDNNFVVTVKDNQLLFKQVKYRRDCDCDEATDIVVDVIKRTEFQLPTGTTKHHLVIVFRRDISLTEEELKYKGSNLDCDGLPNNHWYDGKKYRGGTVRIYLDGLLRETIVMEEPVFRTTEDDMPHVQGWGLGDETIFSLSVDHGVAGSYLGSLVRGRFYTCPLKGDEIRTNFELLAIEHNLTNNLTSC